MRWKNASTARVAEKSWFVLPTHRPSRDGAAPGQVWPPPLTT